MELELSKANASATGHQWNTWKYKAVVASIYRLDLKTEGVFVHNAFNQL